MSSIAVHAQVTQFLGIPVDGSKPEMIRKLKEKGFESDAYNKDVLVGEFNGSQVYIHTVTNNNKVYRIMVCDANTVDERSIQIRFNNLYKQFTDNPKYIALTDYAIPDDEDISYEMTVNHKRYEATFLQMPTNTNPESIAEDLDLASKLESKYTKEQLANPTEELRTDISKLLFESCSKRLVWFIISKHLGRYFITMFYDNEYNRANGEDL